MYQISICPGRGFDKFDDFIRLVLEKYLKIYTQFMWVFLKYLSMYWSYSSYIYLFFKFSPLIFWMLIHLVNGAFSSLLTYVWVLVKIFHQGQFVLLKDSCMCGLIFFLICQLASGYTLRNLSSNLQLAETINSSDVTCGISYPPLHSMLGFDLTWACTNLVYVVTTTVSSYVQIPC